MEQDPGPDEPPTETEGLGCREREFFLSPSGWSRSSTTEKSAFAWGNSPGPMSFDDAVLLDNMLEISFSETVEPGYEKLSGTLWFYSEMGTQAWTQAVDDGRVTIRNPTAILRLAPSLAAGEYRGIMFETNVGEGPELDVLEMFSDFVTLQEVSDLQLVSDPGYQLDTGAYRISALKFAYC